jgi:hypothetical protein
MGLMIYGAVSLPHCLLPNGTACMLDVLLIDLTGQNGLYVMLLVTSGSKQLTLSPN